MSLLGLCLVSYAVLDERTTPLYPDRMETLLSRLGAAGVRITAQRRIIAECLDGMNQHLTADEILDAAKTVMPEIGRATVYKALAEFVDSGIVREVQFGGGPKHFDPNAHIDHHHLICSTCEQVWDLDAAVCEIKPGGDSGFVLTHAEVGFYGQCAACSEAVIG